MSNSADGSSNFARLAGEKKRKENRLRSESTPVKKITLTKRLTKSKGQGGFPGGPGIKNLYSNVRDASLIASGGTKIPHVSRQKKKYFFCFK